MSQASFATHEVFNQSPPFEDVDLFAVDRPLAGGGSGQWRRFEQRMSEFGQHWGLAAMAEGPCRQWNTRKTADLRFPVATARRGRVSSGLSDWAHSAHAGVHNSTWSADGKPAGGASEVVRAAKFYIASQVETGHLCPITMTCASVAALAEQPDLLAKVMPVLATGSYDPTFRRGGASAACGRHGHDREAGRHRCALQHDGRRARRRCLSYHRPQMVHVGADVRCVSALAQAGGGRAVSRAALCADGTDNAIRFQRLKGQARQPLQRVIRSGIHRRLCGAHR